MDTINPITVDTITTMLTAVMVNTITTTVLPLLLLALPSLLLHLLEVLHLLLDLNLKKHPHHPRRLKVLGTTLPCRLPLLPLPRR